MSPAADALRRLRGAIAASVAMLAISLGLGVYANYRHDHHTRSENEERRERAESQNRLETLRREVERLDASAANHAAMLADGRLGEFVKTRQVDRFERVARTLRSPKGPIIQRYTLKPRVPLAAYTDTGLTQHTLSMQPLTFEAVGRHEEEFLAAWNGLAAGLGGLSTVEACELKLAQPPRSGAAGASKAEGLGGAAKSLEGPVEWPVLKASCTVTWYVVEPKADTVGGAGAPVVPSPPLPTGPKS
jgi:hypothetical protein